MYTRWESLVDVWALVPPVVFIGLRFLRHLEKKEGKMLLTLTRRDQIYFQGAHSHPCGWMSECIQEQSVCSTFYWVEMTTMHILHFLP